MKRLKLIRNIDSLDGEVQFNTEPGRIEGLLVLAEGTNASGQTGAASDVGRFIIERNGDQTHNRTFDVFQNIGDIRAGTNLATSTSASTFRMSCFIPFFEVGFPNALNITGPSELNVRFQPAAGQSTTFDSLNVKVYAQIVDHGEAYQYYMLGNDLNLSGATQKVEPLNRQNISSLYLSDPDTELNKVQLEASEQIAVSNIDFNALQAYTIYNNRIEDASFTLAQIMVATPGVPGSSINRNAQITVDVGGTCDIPITVCAMKWSKAA